MSIYFCSRMVYILHNIVVTIMNVLSVGDHKEKQEYLLDFPSHRNKSHDIFIYVMHTTMPLSQPRAPTRNYIYIHFTRFTPFHDHMFSLLILVWKCREQLLWFGLGLEMVWNSTEIKAISNV